MYIQPVQFSQPNCLWTGKGRVQLSVHQLPEGGKLALHHLKQTEDNLVLIPLPMLSSTFAILTS